MTFCGGCSRPRRRPMTSSRRFASAGVMVRKTIEQLGVRALLDHGGRIRKLAHKPKFLDTSIRVKLGYFGIRGSAPYRRWRSGASQRSEIFATFLGDHKPRCVPTWAGG